MPEERHAGRDVGMAAGGGAAGAGAVALGPRIAQAVAQGAGTAWGWVSTTAWPAVASAAVTAGQAAVAYGSAAIAGTTWASVGIAAGATSLIAIPVFGGVYYVTVHKYRKMLEEKASKSERESFYTQVALKTTLLERQGFSGAQAGQIAFAAVSALWGQMADPAQFRSSTSHADAETAVLEAVAYMSIPYVNDKYTRLATYGINEDQVKVLWQKIRKIPGITKQNIGDLWSQVYGILNAGRGLQAANQYLDSYAQ